VPDVRQESSVHQGLQQSGAGLLVQAPEAAGLFDGQPEAGHLQVLTANTLKDMFGHANGGRHHVFPRSGIGVAVYLHCIDTSSAIK
jgi:hypothetical protein